MEVTDDRYGISAGAGLWVPAVDQHGGEARGKACRSHRIDASAQCGIDKDQRNSALIDTGFNQAAKYRLRGNLSNRVDRYRADAGPALLAKVVITPVLLSVRSD